MPVEGGQQPPVLGGQYKQFQPKDTEVFLRLLKWGMKAVDIYAVNGPVPGQPPSVPQRPINTQGVRSKEEKEVLEHFAGAVRIQNILFSGSRN